MPNNPDKRPKWKRFKSIQIVLPVISVLVFFYTLPNGIACCYASIRKITSTGFGCTLTIANAHYTVYCWYNLVTAFSGGHVNAPESTPYATGVHLVDSLLAILVLVGIGFGVASYRSTPSALIELGGAVIAIEVAAIHVNSLPRRSALRQDLTKRF